jgi:hypothetical protein
VRDNPIRSSLQIHLLALLANSYCTHVTHTLRDLQFNLHHAGRIAAPKLPAGGVDLVTLAVAKLHP